MCSKHYELLVAIVWHNAATVINSRFTSNGGDKCGQINEGVDGASSYCLYWQTHFRAVSRPSSSLSNQARSELEASNTRCPELSN